MGRHSLGRQLLALSLALLLVTGGVSVAVQTGAIDSEDVSPAQPADAILATAATIAGIAVGTGVALYAADFFLSDGEVASQEEALQQKIDLYQIANTQGQNGDDMTTSVSNHLNGADTLLKMEGMNALTNASENDATLTEANDAVTTVIDDRTTTKEMNALNSWSAAATNVKYIETVVANSSGLSDSFSGANLSVNTPSVGGWTYTPGANVYVDESLDWNKTVTLENGTTMNVTAVPVTVEEDSSGSDWNNKADESQTLWFRPGVSDSRSVTFNINSDAGDTDTYTFGVTYYGYDVTRPEDDAVLTGSGPATFAVHDRYSNLISTIRSNNNDATQAVTDLAAAEYSSLRDGSISINETITPYYADHLYDTAGNDSSAWLLNMEAALGAATPENLDTVMQMTVDHNGTVYNGMLMSDGLPPNGTFEAGVTYDPANLSGNQFMITEDGAKPQLTEPFTVTQIENADGTNATSVTYEQPQYNVTSIDGFRQMTDYLMDKRAESEAREKQAEASGGALFDFGGVGGVGLGLGLGGLGGFLMLAAVVLLALSASSAGGGGTVIRELNRRRGND